MVYCAVAGSSAERNITMSDIQIIQTEAAPAAIGPYSQGFFAGNFVLTSGQIPVDPETGTVPEGITAQAEQSCKNVSAVLQAGGSDLSRVLKTTCFLRNMADFAAFNEVYAAYCKFRSVSTTCTEG